MTTVSEGGLSSDLAMCAPILLVSLSAASHGRPHQTCTQIVPDYRLVGSPYARTFTCLTSPYRSGSEGQAHQAVRLRSSLQGSSG